MARRWNELSGRQHTVIVALGCVQVGLTAAALLDLARRPTEQVRGSRKVWAAAAFVNFVGPISYFLAGRVPAERAGSRAALSPPAARGSAAPWRPAP